MKSLPLKTLVSVSAFASLVALNACQSDHLVDAKIPETNAEPTSASIQGNVFEPALVSATDERIAQLKVPAGFKISKYADQLGKPRMLAITPSGNVYVSSRAAGTVTLLQDTNGDGVAEAKRIVATIPDIHGLAIYGSKLYMIAIKELFVADMASDGSLSQPQQLIADLPDGGQHPNRTIAIGPDNKLYITVGSTCNACIEPNKESATILRANLDGSGRVIFAKGLRNTIGFGWHPQTKELFGFDHGIDWLGDEDQREEFNLIKEGADYGWPHIYADGKYNPHPRPEGMSYAEYLAKTTLPVLLYQAHAAPLGMLFYMSHSASSTSFPAEYQNDVFATMRGSWNRTEPSGYSVIRVHFENGKPIRTEDFVTGFLVNNNQAQFGRPVGIATLPDGSLLFSEDNNGVIYRVSRN